MTPENPADAAEEAAPPLHPPSLYEAAAQLPIPTMRFVPAACRNAVARELESALADPANLLLFAKFVLAETHRGGKNRSRAKVVFARLAVWQRNSIQGRLEIMQQQVRDQRRSRRQREVQPHVRAERLARSGLLTKAMQALRAAKMAPADEETLRILRELHPASPKPNSPPPIRFDDIDITDANVMDAVHSFPPGSAPGPSGLRAEHLQNLLAASGSRLLGKLTGLVRRIARGEVDTEAPEGKYFYFSARLIGLLKPGTTETIRRIRPIAIGEVIRRVAFKAVLRLPQVADKLRNYFQRHHQYAICTTDGCLGVAQAFTAIAQDLPPNVVIVKVDATNGFNTTSRSAFLRECREVMPELFPMYRAAYDGEAALYVVGSGDSIIMSRSGTHQGCPGGPAGYSFNAAQMDRHLDAIGGLVRAWIMDDLNARVPIAQLAQFFAILDSHTEDLGYFLNKAKSEIIAPDAESLRLAREAAPGLGAYHLASDNWVVLGAPGNPAQVHALDDFIEESRKLFGELTAITATQVALTLLVRCAAFPRAVFLMRAIGSHPAFGDFDREVIEAFEKITGVPLDAVSMRQVRLPLRLGGFGLRSAVDHGPLAHVAALRSTHDVVHSISASLPPTVPRTLQLSLETSSCRSLHITSLADVANLDLKVQQKLSRAYDDAIHQEMLSDSGHLPGNQARLLATSGSNRGGWIMQTTGLDSQSVGLLVRLRLGMTVFPQDCMCPSCHGHCDAFGAHTLKCPRLKHHVHRMVESEVEDLCEAAGLNPRVRPGALAPVVAPPAPVPDPQRNDNDDDDAASAHDSQEPNPAQPSQQRAPQVIPDTVVPVFKAGREAVIDYAHIYPLQDLYIDASSRVPGSAATQYEAVKRTHYRGHIREETQELVPFIVESYGGLGASAAEFLTHLAFLWGRNHNVGPSRAIPYVFDRVSLAIARGVAKILQQTASMLPSSPEVELPEEQPEDSSAADDHVLSTAMPRTRLHTAAMSAPADTTTTIAATTTITAAADPAAPAGAPATA